MMGNRLTVVDPDLGACTYQYDAAKRLVAQTNARVLKTALTYDKTGRLLICSIVLAVIADPVLTNNTYDEAQAT
jgi:YD repeat-containing protein